MTFLLVLSFGALLWLALLLSPPHRAGFANLLHAATPLPDPPDWPAVTVLIPARNEAKVLATTLPTLCRQDYPDLRVILVNDQSEDDSATVLQKLAAEHANLRVIPGRPRPQGWCGKPWAVKQAADAADSAWLLLTDADVGFHPLAVRQAMRLARHEAYDMVSLFPQLIFSSTLEKIGMGGLVSIIGLIFPPGLANNPKSKVALAAGGFILVRRAAYDAIGGHESVRNEIVEDVNLARKLKESGARLHCRFTQDLVWTRMYEDWPDLWEGLAKNAYAGMEYQPRKFWVGLVFAVVFVVLPPVYLAVGAALAVGQPSARHLALAGIAALLCLAQALVHRRTVRFLQLPPWHALLMPASAAIYCGVACVAAWRHHFGGGTSWKGRRYAKEMLTPPGR